MDFEDATDTNDSQAFLATEFNNQATLSQELKIVSEQTEQLDEPDAERYCTNFNPYSCLH